MELGVEEKDYYDYCKELNMNDSEALTLSKFVSNLDW